MPPFEFSGDGPSQGSVKNKAVGSAIWIAAVALVFFVFLEPPAIDAGKMEPSANASETAADDGRQPQAELAAAAMTTERLEDALAENSGNGSAAADSASKRSASTIILKKDKREAPDEAEQAAKSPAAGDWYVQVGAFQELDYAKSMRVKAKNSGYSVHLRKGQDNLTRLLVGPYSTEATATKATADIIAKLEVKDAFVVQADPG